MKIIGYKVNSFDTPDGKHISGVTFYCTQKTEGNNCFGLIGKKFFVSDQKLNGQKFEIGMEAVPIYNEYGKIQSVMFK